MNDSLHFTADETSEDIRQRLFTVGEVSGALWTSPTGSERAPLVLLGHGGGNHRTHPAMTGRAGKLVLDGCFSAVAIDAPGHGDRPATAHDQQEIDAMQAAMRSGEPVGEIVARYNGHLAEQAVPEWLAVLDALQALPEIGADGPVGYYGNNMGTAIGVPLVAAEPRITAAVFGQFWPETLVDLAKRITIPVEFAMQWDDEHIPRESALALFDAFGSAEKSLHANAGRHKELPRFEADSAVRFFRRHLKRR